MIPTNAALLISGPSGRGKSTLLATAAEWLWNTHKKVLRLYTCDLGGFPDRVDDAIRLGILEVWRVRTRVGAGAEGLIEETCARASQGWWPFEIDPLTGETHEGTALVPWTAKTFVMKCPAGHEVKRSTIQANLTPQLCPGCNTLTNLTNGSVATVGVPNFPHVGALAFDGLTSMSDWVMMSLSDRRGRNEIAGEKAALGNIKSGDMNFGGNNRADYGFAQGQAEKWLMNCTALTGLSLPPIWTALETKTDDVNVLPFWGPMIAGQAKTGKVPQWVGNYLGTQTVINEKGNKEWRLYLTEYRDKDDPAPHLYKTRVEPGMLPEFLADGEGEPPFTTFNMGVFFTKVSEAMQISLDKAKQRVQDAPGIVKREAPKQEVPVNVPQPPAQAAAPALGARPPATLPPRPATLPPAGKPLVKAPLVGGKK